MVYNRRLLQHATTPRPSLLSLHSLETSFTDAPAGPHYSAEMLKTPRSSDHDTYEAAMGQPVTADFSMAFESNRQRYNTPISSSPPTYHANFRPMHYTLPSYPGMTNLDSISPISANTTSGLELSHTTTINDQHQLWHNGLSFSESRGLEHLSLAGPLFHCNAIENMSPSYHTADHGLMTPASSAFSPSDSDSVGSSNMNRSHTDMYQTSIVPSQAFPDESMLAHSMNLDYGSDSRSPTITPSDRASDLRYRSPLDRSTFSLDTPIRELSSFTFESPPSPSERMASRTPEIQRSDERPGRPTRTRRRSTRTRAQGLQYQVMTDDGVVLEVLHEDGISSEAIHTCMALMDNGQPCGDRFKRQEHLKRHLTKHTKEKRHICPFYSESLDCSKKKWRCSRNDNWADHVATHAKCFIDRQEAKKARNRNDPVDPLVIQLRVLDAFPDRKMAIQKLESIQKKVRKHCGPDPVTGRVRQLFPILQY